MNTPSSQFSDLGISSHLLKKLNQLKFTVPTPIQHKAIPIALEGKDVMGVAQTGTGKTLAFAIPIMERLSRPNGRALVLLPTRELAIQVEEAFAKVGGSFGLRTTVLIGGAPIKRQISELRKNPHVIVATPGRLIDHIDQKTIHLDKTEILVLDEADRMLDMGFAPQINRILKTVPKERQTMLFSATMPKEIVDIAMHYMKLPIQIEVAPAGTTAEKVEQEVFIVKKHEKDALLEVILSAYKGTALVFTRTKYTAKKICRKLNQHGHSATEIHSNRSLNQRMEALKGFHTGKYRIMVATDIAARGIDVKNMGLVINYDIPEQSEDYVHRIGRTGRAGQAGHAVTFAMPDQKGKVRDIERIIKMAIKVSKTPNLPDLPEPEKNPERPSSRPPSERQVGKKNFKSGGFKKRSSSRGYHGAKGRTRSKRGG